MNPARTDVPRRDQDRGAVQALSTAELVKELAAKASLLAKKEIELAKTEAKADLRAEIKMASGLGIAGVCALITVQTLLVALAFGLAEAGVMRGWIAALLVAFVVLAIGTAVGLTGWAKRVKKPLAATRQSVEENVRWVKERMA